MNERHRKRTSGFLSAHPSTTTVHRAVVRLLLAGLLIGAVGASQAASTVPFDDDFEYDASLAGTNGWGAAGDGSAIATNGRARLVDVTLSNAFDAVEEAVTITFDLQPNFRESGPGSVADGVAVVMYVKTNGMITAYSGETETNLTHTPLTETNETQLALRLDYPAKKWALWVAGAEVATNLDFYSALGGSAFSEFAVMEASTNAFSYLDDVSVAAATSSLPSLVSFALVAASFDEDVADATVTVTLDRTSANEVRVDHFLADWTADFGPDFTNYAGGTLIFAPGQTSTSFSFTVINDAEDEVDETIVFGLQNLVNADPGTYTNFTYTILHDLADEPATVSFLTVGIERRESETVGSVPVILSSAQASTVTVTHAVLPDSTATAGVDYEDYTPGTLTFEPGETSKAITFTVIEDGVEEESETIIFALSGIVNVEAGAFTNFTYVIGSDSNYWYSLPFVETFESGELGDLDGQRGWVATSAVVQTTNVYAGAKAAELSTLTNALSHSFTGTHNSVWTELRAQPVFGQPAAPPADSTFAFFVQTNGHVWAYDGGSAIDMTPPAPVLTEGQWVLFSVHSDYVNKNWELYVNGIHAGFNLGFRDTSATTYTEFGVQSSGSSNGHLRAYIDDIEIGLSRPKSLSTGMLFIIR